MYKKKFKNIKLSKFTICTINISKLYQFYLNSIEILENNFILIYISGSDFRQRILTSVSAEPVITIPRPGGPRKTFPGKNQSSDGNTMSKS